MIVPILTAQDIPRAIAFYTEVLDFSLGFAWPADDPIHVGLTRGEDENAQPEEGRPNG